MLSRFACFSKLLCSPREAGMEVPGFLHHHPYGKLRKATKKRNVVYIMTYSFWKVVALEYLHRKLA